MFYGESLLRKNYPYHSKGFFISMRLNLKAPTLAEKVQESAEGAKDRVLSSIQDLNLNVTSPFRNGFESYRRHVEAKLLMDTPDALVLTRTKEGVSNLIFSREEIDPKTAVRKSFRLSVSGTVPNGCSSPVYFVSLNSGSERAHEQKTNMANRSFKIAEKILEDKARRILVELPEISQLENGGFEELKGSLNVGARVHLNDSFFDSAGGETGWARIVTDDRVILRAQVSGITVDVSRRKLPDGEPCFCASVLIPDFRPEAAKGHRSMDSRKVMHMRNRFSSKNGDQAYERLESPMIELMTVGGAAVAGIFNRLESVAFDNVISVDDLHPAGERPRISVR